jgi:hypothetical protein
MTSGATAGGETAAANRPRRNVIDPRVALLLIGLGGYLGADKLERGLSQVPGPTRIKFKIKYGLLKILC